MRINQKNNRKILIYTTIITSLLFCCCKQHDNNNLPKTEITEKIIDTIVVAPKNDNTKIVIDSVKMHAFENIYFGTFDEIGSKKYSINDDDYYINTHQILPNKGLCFMMLECQSLITTQKKAKKILNDLRITISKKYNSGSNVNKTYLIKHPEEMEKNETFFDTRTNYKYDKKLIGLPYEFVAYKWDLKYKEIKIGYLLEHKNRTVTYGESSPKSDNYSIYIEIKSKIIKQ